MANLLDEASILLTPTAYNNGSILAIQPSDGSGDMTFSRGSSATRVNEQGLIEDVQILSSNLVSNGDFSQEGSQLITNGNFATDTDWILGTGWSIGDGKAISDGTQTSQSNLYQSGVVPINKTYKVTFSTVVTSGSLVLAIGGSNPQSTVTTSGTYTYTSKTTIGDSNLYFSASSDFIGSITNISVKEVGQDWTLGTGTTIGDGIANITQSGSVLSQSGGIMVSGKSFKITFTISNYVSGSIAISNLTPTIYRSGNGTYTLNAVGAGGDFKFFSSSFTGSVTNISVIEITDDTNLPRIDYTDGCGSLLLEPQSTNLIPYSELFSDAYWTKSGSIVVSGFVSPDGTNNAFKLVENNITFVGVQSNPSITSGVDYTFSAYAKAIENNYLFFNFNSKNSGFVNEYVWFNLLTGVVGTSEGSIVASIKEISNGFYRCIATATAISTTYGRVVIGTSINDGSYAPSGVIPTDGCYIYGAQLEQNSFSTSYIPTQGGATSTRLQDIATNSGNASLINSEEGVLYFEGSALSDDLTNRYLGLSDNSQSNRIAIGFTSAGANRIRLLMTSGIGNYVDISYTVSNITSNTKIAISYKLNDVSLWVNGLKVGTDTSAVMPSGLSELNFDSGTGGSPFYGKTKALAVFPYLTDAQLTLLTTI